MRVSYEQNSKKRKITDEPKAKETGETVLDHYFNFIYGTLDVLDRHEQFRGHHLIIDNAPIQVSDQIEKLIISRGYICVYFLPYSPELNPIEQFLSVVKSKLKREKPLKEETLSLRIADPCNSVYLEDFRGYCHYSDSCLQLCLNKELIFICIDLFHKVMMLSFATVVMYPAIFIQVS